MGETPALISVSRYLCLGGQIGLNGSNHYG